VRTPRNILCYVALMALAFSFAGCATRPDVYERGTAVAVWDLENLTPLNAPQPDLGEVLSAEVIQILKEEGAWTVVERERLLLALEELGLGSGDLADEASRLRLGRLVGARLMVFGAYQVVQHEMRLDLRLVEVETGKVLKATEKTTSAGGLSGWLEAARYATAELL